MQLFLLFFCIYFLYDLIANKSVKQINKSGLVEKLKVVIVATIQQHCSSTVVFLCIVSDVLHILRCDCVGRLIRMLATFHSLTCWSCPLKCRV